MEGGGRELSLSVVLQAAVGCAGLLRVRVAAKKVPGVRFFLFSPHNTSNMSLRRVKPQLEDYDDGGVAISDLDSGSEEEEEGEGAESMDDDDDDDDDEDGSGSSSSGEEEDEEVWIPRTPRTPPSF